jgi:hypothetical protein
MRIGRGIVVGLLVLAPLVADAAEDGQWHAVSGQDALRRELMFPNSVFLQIGFHFFPVMEFDTGLTPTPHDKPATRDDFRRVLYEEFDARYLAGASFELGYGRRFHKHFGIQVQGGFVNQRTERHAPAGGSTATVKYQYVGGFILALAQARFPVSKLDFAIGLGPQVALAFVKFQIRGVATFTDPDTQEISNKGFHIEEEERLVAGVGGVAQAAMEYRIRDNWGIQIEYRFAMVPTTFKGYAFDQGGHYGLLSNYFHF